METIRECMFADMKKAYPGASFVVFSDVQVEADEPALPADILVSDQPPGLLNSPNDTKVKGSLDSNEITLVWLVEHLTEVRDDNS